MELSERFLDVRERKSCIQSKTCFGNNRSIIFFRKVCETNSRRHAREKVSCRKCRRWSMVTARSRHVELEEQKKGQQSVI